jgi:hypothetical protein
VCTAHMPLEAYGVCVTQSMVAFSPVCFVHHQPVSQSLHSFDSHPCLSPLLTALLLPCTPLVQMVDTATGHCAAWCRSKITSWLSSQEEEYRYIILEGDYHPTPWSSVCVAQVGGVPRRCFCAMTETRS